MKEHQIGSKRHNEALVFKNSLEYLEKNLEYSWLEKIDEMIEVLTSKAQDWYRANKYAVNMDVYYSELEVFALRRFKCKIYQWFRLKESFSV